MDVAQKGLVLYKGRPALVKKAGDRLEIETQSHGARKVRTKDVVALHPGPLASLAALAPPEPALELEEVWELVAGEEAVTLSDLADLLFGETSPGAVWAAWEQVADGLLFQGDPDRVVARPADEVASERQRREERRAEAERWEAFVARLEAGTWDAADAPYLQEVEQLALERGSGSRVLRSLGRAEAPENAHALLLEIGYWDAARAPHAQRRGLILEAPALDVPPLGAEARLDLTHLPALAIDDEGNRDPDDAVSVDDGRLWVHVADVGALAPPDSPLDLEARARATTLYLPDGNIPMLPPGAVDVLGLGLTDPSPALSFGIDLAGDGHVADVQVATTWVRVDRLSYGQAETRLQEEPLASLMALAEASHQRRLRDGAVDISWPEARIRVVDGQVRIEPMEPYRIRRAVAESMILAGEAAALYATDHDLPFPYSTQVPVEGPLAEGDGLAGEFARRRQLRPGRLTSEAGPHAALGLASYTRATSPLRRYLDLVVHQQLRAHLGGGEPMPEDEILERLGSAAAAVGAARQAERLTNRHWTLVYLQQNPEWRGTGVVAEMRGPRATVVVPELALETGVYLSKPPELNAELHLKVRGVDLPRLEAHLELA